MVDELRSSSPNNFVRLNIKFVDLKLFLSNYVYAY